MSFSAEVQYTDESPMKHVEHMHGCLWKEDWNGKLLWIGKKNPHCDFNITLAEFFFLCTKMVNFFIQTHRMKQPFLPQFQS